MASSTQAQISVLSFSHDSSLLMTRRWLLNLLRIGAVDASTIAEARRAMLLEQPLQMLLLCQSVTPEECAEAATFAEEHMVHAKLLILCNGTAKYRPPRDHVVLDTGCGPEAFLATVERMLPGCWHRDVPTFHPSELELILPSSAAPR